MESSSTKLCDQCTSFEYKLGATARKQHPLQKLSLSVNLAPNIWALQRSAKEGCVLCRLIYQAILYRHPGILQSDLMSMVSIGLSSLEHTGIKHLSDEGGGEKHEVGSTIEGGSRAHSILRARLDTRRIVFSAWMLGGGRKLDANDDYYSVQGVEAIAKLGKKWLLEYCTVHKQCNEASQEGHSDHVTSHIIPTRLVDVGIDGDEMFPRLTITNGSGLYSEYATLSYAWGDENLGIKTTSSNLQGMTKKIDPSNLSKTIREAFIMTRKLGIRYLWVDALCILQSQGSDDAQHELDWQHEAARFGQYYENSILTIAATGAQSASEGLFPHRAGQVGSFEPYTVRWTVGADVPKEVTIYPKVPCWEDELMLSPLATRGWAAQERLISRRILHFAANCVCWECYELQATEGDPSGCVLDYIMTYSKKRFTHVSDRLPALSALASRVQSRIPHQYMEGIWADNDVSGLAWKPTGDFWADSPKQPAVPSWSWASARGSVEFWAAPT
ncbi:tol protein [Rhypophila decipiens]|uniref:Tol protein n=1 Tax=Rhypophila decipiens TaxID=261697 RepID=A0AAN6XXP0_9PEZI|nr:tol protein [Rhypophila decipiens]